MIIGNKNGARLIYDTWKGSCVAKTFIKTFAVLFAFSLIAAACGGDSDETAIENEPEAVVEEEVGIVGIVVVEVGKGELGKGEVGKGEVGKEKEEKEKRDHQTIKPEAIIFGISMPKSIINFQKRAVCI